MPGGDITGEHAVVNIEKRYVNGVTWKWLLGAVTGAAVVLGGGLFGILSRCRSSTAWSTSFCYTCSPRESALRSNNKVRLIKV